MSVVVILIGLSVLFAAGFLAAFLWALRHGQYDDPVTPAIRMLFDDEPGPGRGSASATTGPSEDVPRSRSRPAPNDRG